MNNKLMNNKKKIVIVMSSIFLNEKKIRMKGEVPLFHEVDLWIRIQNKIKCPQHWLKQERCSWLGQFFIIEVLKNYFFVVGQKVNFCVCFSSCLLSSTPRS